MGRPANKDGLTAKERHACELRAGGLTQVEAYRISHKAKEDSGRELHNKTYKLFRKPETKKYLRELWDAKPLEDILTRQEWLGMMLDLISLAVEKDKWGALPNLTRQAGQAVAALREGLVAVRDGGERDKELREALAGSDPQLKKALELIMGKHEVFGTPHVVVDNTKPMNGADKGKGGKGK